MHPNTCSKKFSSQRGQWRQAPYPIFKEFQLVQGQENANTPSLSSARHPFYGSLAYAYLLS